MNFIKTIFDWLVIFAFMAILCVWVFFAVIDNLLLSLLNILEKRIDNFI